MVHENIFYEVQACIVILHIYNTLNRPCICKDTLHTGADPGFQVRGGGTLKKIAPSRGRREHFRGISCEKSLFYAKKS